ncbi:UTP--glucose-1-phosphate uridylyltransferase [Roseimaritima sediminicola]|uniref:UTP--glucose-1-phosphate uridylyltransferase n=1 Tax=Roseimaritima sediminicola TaxID=2662066 RepID=UPI001298295B|nr:UDPGP type 1 family protein [Roseimaritima sediminicola]
MSLPPNADLPTLRNHLAQYSQSHLVQFWEQLSAQEQDRLRKQLAEIDFEQLAQLVAGKDDEVDFAALAARSTPPPSVDARGEGADWTVEQALAKGREALSQGQVAAVIVAGGQGTRLGFDKPKGMFPIGPLSERTLFQIFADRLLAIGDAFGVSIPLYLMTSPATHDETVAYWEENQWLGMSPDDVRVFCQGTMPAVDARSGRVLLADKDQIALSPDGHGGTVAALKKSGCLADAQRRGVRYLSYGQVDNPLVYLCDPGLIGHHIAADSEMTTQVVRKRYPTEKVGNVVLADGKVQIIEYSDLPEEAAHQKDDDGQLKLWAGSIAVHVCDVDFFQRMSDQADALPFHRANKKVPYIDEHGDQVSPEQPNAIKFERFIFDLLPAAKNAFVVEGLPEDVFAPVKNADGAPADTPELARQAMVEQARRQLEEAGIEVAEGVQVEINPRFALDAEALRSKLAGTKRIERDTYFQ